MWKNVISLLVVVVLMTFNIQASSIPTAGAHEVGNGTEESSNTSIKSTAEKNQTPDHFEVRQNYPNPFNAMTTIEYDLPEGAEVYVVVYNILGHRVRTLMNELKRAGRHKLEWNGITNNGDEAASGIYFYVLLADENYSTGKMLLLK